MEGAHQVFVRDGGRPSYLPSSSSTFSSNHSAFVLPSALSLAYRASSFYRLIITLKDFMVFRLSRKYSALLLSAKCIASL